MAILLRRMLAVGGCIIGSASMPTGTQAVLTFLDGTDALELPHFGVGFDLTASYGQDTQPIIEGPKS